MIKKSIALGMLGIMASATAVQRITVVNGSSIPKNKLVIAATGYEKDFKALTMGTGESMHFDFEDTVRTFRILRNLYAAYNPFAQESAQVLPSFDNVPLIDGATYTFTETGITWQLAPQRAQSPRA